MNENDEQQAWPQDEVQGTNSECDADFAQFGDRGTGYDGQNSEAEIEVPTHYKNRSGRDRARRLTGGILRQLITDYEDQLADTLRRSAKLQARIDELKQLQLLQSKD